MILFPGPTAESGFPEQGHPDKCSQIIHDGRTGIFPGHKKFRADAAARDNGLRTEIGYPEFADKSPENGVKYKHRESDGGNRQINAPYHARLDRFPHLEWIKIGDGADDKDRCDKRHHQRKPVHWRIQFQDRIGIHEDIPEKPHQKKDSYGIDQSGQIIKRQAIFLSFRHFFFPFPVTDRSTGSSARRDFKSNHRYRKNWIQTVRSWP